MTEQKKAFIADALGEIADDFVAEAVEYQKVKPSWKYTRELATVAACAAVLLVSLNILRMMPIGSTETATNEARPENMQEATAMESYMTERELTYVYGYAAVLIVNYYEVCSSDAGILKSRALKRAAVAILGAAGGIEPASLVA